MRRCALSVLVAVLAITPIVANAADAIGIHTLPGAGAFPESIGADPRTGEFSWGRR